MTTDEQCVQAAEQAQCRTEWVVVQVGAGQPQPQGLPLGATLRLAPAMLRSLHVALHALGDRPEHTGHLVVHQRGGSLWLLEHITPLRSWVSTVAGLGFRSTTSRRSAQTASRPWA